MERAFEQDVEKLKVDVLTAFRFAQAAMGRAVRALFSRDRGLGESVIRDDENIDRLECALDAEGLRLLALWHPVAVDLRYIVGVLRSASDIERIGDQAVNIAERSLLLQNHPPLPSIPRLEVLAELTLATIEKSTRAFAELSVEAARELCRDSDDALELHIRIFKEMTEYMINASRTVERAVQVCFISHALRRACDQCVNVAETIIFIKEGACNRHQCE